jgi:predicted N-acetyltransferase YhbS
MWPTRLDIAIRDEAPEDVAAIRELTRRAFASMPHSDGREPEIIDALRREGALAISLVALRDQQVVGHVAFSPATAADGTADWYALGPVAVDPPLQRKGIGSALIERGIERLRERDAAGCIVIGDPSYYTRFGFRSAPALAPPSYPSEFFMLLPLSVAEPTAAMGFHPAFGATANPHPPNQFTGPS